MAKEKEKEIAKFHYIYKLATIVEAAKMAGVTEKTVSGWVAKYAWRQERDARSLSFRTRLENLNEILKQSAQDRITLGNDLNQALLEGDIKRANDIRAQISRVDDGASKWRKKTENISKEDDVDLSIYLLIMDCIFEALRVYDLSLFLQTIDFQEKHVHEVSLKKG